MSPCWRLLLLSDGSLTRHLQLVTGLPHTSRTRMARLTRPVLPLADAADVEVEVTAHHVLGSPNLELLPQECQSLRPPLVQRQVYLRPVAAPGGGAPLSDRPAPERPLVYACSWWHEADFEASMSRVGAPIWRNLSAQRAECYRQPACLVLGDPAVVEGEGLEAAFGRKGPFWGRWYTLWRGGRVLTVIYEVFNPQLGDWAGDNDGRGLAGL